MAGPIRPLGAPLTSPFGGRPCVAYEYEVVQQLPSRKGHASSQKTDIAGFGMAASAIDTPDASVRLLGFPILDQFPQSRDSGPDVAARARQYAASAPFETMRGVGALQMFASFDDALADADGAVRKDFRMTEEAIPFERRTLGERIVGVGQEVCALGRYDAEKRALVPRGATLNRLWPGTPAKVRREIVATARSQAVLGLTFFAVSHAMLGAAFYLSETRYARESEDRQASALRSALQDNDVAALERVVRQGANPNARDTYGDAVLLDVREPAMAAALVRLGADVNVRHRDDADTPLIRAARMGNVELVRILLAAHADVHARMTERRDGAQRSDPGRPRRGRRAAARRRSRRSRSAGRALAGGRRGPAAVAPRGRSSGVSFPPWSSRCVVRPSPWAFWQSGCRRAHRGSSTGSSPSKRRPRTRPT